MPLLLLFFFTLPLSLSLNKYFSPTNNFSLSNTDFPEIFAHQSGFFFLYTYEGG